MKWIDYREKLGIGLNNDQKFKMLLNMMQNFICSVCCDMPKKAGILPNITPGMEWVITGEGVATEKIDGSCCAIIDGVFYK